MIPDCSSHALPESCSTWSRALATAAPMNYAATSAAGAPGPATWSKWHPQRDPLRSAFDTLLRPIRARRAAHGDPRHRHEQALRAGRRSPPRDSHMADPPRRQHKCPHGLPSVLVILRNHGWPPPINALSWDSDMAGGPPVVGRRLLPGS